MATGGDDSSEIAKVLEETGAGRVATDVGGIVDNIKKSVNSFVANRTVDFVGDVKRIEKYSYIHAAENLRETLDRVVDL